MVPLPTCRTTRSPGANWAVEKCGEASRKKTLPTLGLTVPRMRLAVREPGTVAQLVVRPKPGALVWAWRRQPMWSVGQERLNWLRDIWAVMPGAKRVTPPHRRGRGAVG